MAQTSQHCQESGATDQSPWFPSPPTAALAGAQTDSPSWFHCREPQTAGGDKVAPLRGLEGRCLGYGTVCGTRPAGLDFRETVLLFLMGLRWLQATPVSHTLPEKSEVKPNLLTENETRQRLAPSFSLGEKQTSWIQVWRDHLPWQNVEGPLPRWELTCEPGSQAAKRPLSPPPAARCTPCPRG